MKNETAYDPSLYSSSEIVVLEDTHDCLTCCDTGTVYTDSGVEEFCECSTGKAALDDYDDRDHDDYSNDAEAFASAGWGTDEDYGGYQYDEWN